MLGVYLRMRELCCVLWSKLDTAYVTFNSDGRHRSFEKV